LCGISEDLARRFFKGAAKVIDVPWGIAVGNDFRHPKVDGARTPKVLFINWYVGKWYVGKLHFAAARDSALATAFLRVANLMISPRSLLMPEIVWLIWRGNRRVAISVTKAASSSATANSARE
jgi:hypothetical protein